MMTIAHRRAVDAVRRNESHKRQDHHTAPDEVSHDEPADAVIEAEEHGAVRECMDTLTDLQLESVRLAYFNGYTYRRGGDSPGEATSHDQDRMRDGLIRLRDCLEGATMSTDLHTLSGAYAVDALSAEEAEEFETHLDACQACRDEVRELQEAAARMGASEALVPPPALKARMLAAADQQPQLPPKVIPRSRRARCRADVGARQLVAAAAAVVLIVAGRRIGVLRASADEQYRDGPDRQPRCSRPPTRTPRRSRPTTASSPWPPRRAWAGWRWTPTGCRP